MKYLVYEKLGGSFFAPALLLTMEALYASLVVLSVRVPVIHTLEIRLPNLPAGLDGFSIVQISDIHIGPLLKKGWLRQVVDKANALKPDLVALTGDMVDGSADRLQAEIAPLGNLCARYGVYGITGNHDYFQAGEWLPVFEKLRILMLCNDHRILSVNGADLVIAGLNDPVATCFGAPGPDIRKT